MRTLTVVVLFSLFWSAPSADAQPGTYQLELGSATGTTGAQVEVPVTIDSTGAEVLAWSLGVCHDPAELELVEMLEGAALGGLDLLFSNISGSQPAGGFHAAVVLDPQLPAGSLPSGVDQELYRVTYEVLAGGPATANLSFCDTLGSPPVETIVTAGLQTVVPTKVDGTVSIEVVEFRRGDCDDNGSTQVTDVVYQLFYVIGGAGVDPQCLNACDFNSDGSVDISDPTTLLQYLFLGGPLGDPLTCGVDPDGFGAPCVSYDSCP